LEAFFDYVMKAPADAQSHLLDTLNFIESKFPSAEMRIYYGLPCFFLNGQGVLSVGAYKKHLGIIVGYDFADYLKSKYPNYSYTRATIQFLYTEPLSYEILEEICSHIADSH